MRGTYWRNGEICPPRGTRGGAHTGGMEKFGCFQLAQRSDFFHVEASVDTMHKRPIVNTRDEPHANPAMYRRLHGIAGDANMSEYATALKIGTTALVLDLVELRVVPDWFTLADPIGAIKAISRDQTYEWEFRLQNGKTISATDLQSEYLSLANRYIDPSKGQNDWVLAEWENVITQLQIDPMQLSDRLDWVAKKWLLKTFVEEEGLKWEDPWLQSLDLAYHNIDPEVGLYYGLEDQGLVRRLLTEEQIEYAVHNPPADTRAYFRGTIVKKFSNEVESIQWDRVTFKSNNISQNGSFTISMDNMVDPELANQYNQLIDQSDTIDQLIVGASKISKSEPKN